MKEKTQIIIGVICIILLITGSLVYYISYISLPPPKPSGLRGDLEPVNIDKSNNSMTFNIFINNTKNIELRKNGEYNFNLHVYNYTENNTWHQWSLDEYRFIYIDKTNDDLLNTGDQLVIKPAEDPLKKFYIIEVELSVTTNEIGGHIITKVKINNVK